MKPGKERIQMYNSIINSSSSGHKESLPRVTMIINANVGRWTMITFTTLLSLAYVPRNQL